MYSHERRVVVTGLGVVSALGYQPDQVLEQLCDGANGISRIARFDVSECPSKVGGILRDFDPKRFILDREGLRRLRMADFLQAMALCVSSEAVMDAGWEEGDVSPERLGVFFGAGRGGFQAAENHVRTQLAVARSWGLDLNSETSDDATIERVVSRASTIVNPVEFLQQCPALVGAFVSMQFNAQGPVMTNVNLCSAGAQAIGEAAWVIRRGDADAMIAGGSDSMLNPAELGGFCALDAVTACDDPEKASRPFDRTRDGCVVGEGAAALVLEELEHARQRGARIYAELLGFGSSCDAHKVSAAPEDGRGAVVAMRRALSDAGLEPTDVDHVNAHGTSTPLNDRIETAAIKTVFGDQAYRIPVVSTKSMTGHLVAAAGALEALIAIKCIQERKIPPTRNLRHPDPKCDLDYVTEGWRPLPELHCVLSNSFAVGGMNGCLIFADFDWESDRRKRAHT